MKKRVLGIVSCMMLVLPIFSLGTLAEPTAEVEISCGYGIEATITNVGYESLFAIPWATIRTLHGGKKTSMSPGMKEPLQPGESMTWTWRPLWVPFFLLPTRQGLPAINKCTVEVKIYENGGDNTIYGIKTINATYIFGFIIPES